MTESHRHPSALRPLHSLESAAGILGLSMSTTRRRVADGTIGTVRVGGRVMVPESALERFMNPSLGAEVESVASEAEPLRTAGGSRS